MDESNEPPFPTEGVVPEHRQIGRIPAIEGLVRRLQQPGQHWALIDDRRIGKSSVALATLGRLAKEPGFVTVAVDLRQLGVRDEREFVAALRRASRKSGIQVHDELKRAGRHGRSVLQGKAPTAVKEIGRLLGLPDEIADTAEIGQTLAGMVGGDEQLNLSEQLLLFEAWGLAHDTAVVVFIDEVQDLANWQSGTTTVMDLANTMRRPLRQTRLLFAGSEHHSMKDLFAACRPLRESTLDYDLAPIAREDWLHELPARFAEMGFTVDREALEAVLDATPERPLRTNQVCLQAAMNAPDYGHADHVNKTVMEYVIELVRRRDRWEGNADDD